MEEQTLRTKIIIFENGSYFSGVKGKMVRSTKKFKDAKTIDELSDRDRKYLESYNYKLIEVEYSIKKI